MRKVLVFSSLVLLLVAGDAFAGRGRGNGGGGRVVVRDHRGGGGGGGGPSRVVVRDHRGGGGSYYRGGGPVYKAKRSPVYVTGGRYVFPGGVVRAYRRPVIRTHYYDVRYRPTIIVESYDPVPGYIWVGGNWRWNGVEWIWISGYWSVDVNF